MGQLRYRFTKNERLHGKKSIEELFKKGSSFYLGGFRVKYLPTSEKAEHQVLISVPKKSFKKAVDRNLLKRRIREAYRLNKHLLNSNTSMSSLSIGFIYISKKILDFHTIQSQLIDCLKRLNAINTDANE